MGPNAHLGVGYHSPRPFVHHATHTKRPVCRQSSEKDDIGADSDHKYGYSDPVNKFLGNFLPTNKAATAEITGIDFEQPKLSGISIQKLRDLVAEGLSKAQWFVTGEVDPRLFADDFTFKDESVATTGIRSYAVGVRKLFDQQTAKAELIAVEVASNNSMVVTWRLEGKVNLPFKPRIKPYVVTTTFRVNSEGLICSQHDEFSVPGWDLLLSTLLGPGFGAPPAPPVQELIAQYNSQTQKQSQLTNTSSK